MSAGRWTRAAGGSGQLIGGQNNHHGILSGDPISEGARSTLIGGYENVLEEFASVLVGGAENRLPQRRVINSSLLGTNDNQIVVGHTHCEEEQGTCTSDPD